MGVQGTAIFQRTVSFDAPVLQLGLGSEHAIVVLKRQVGKALMLKLFARRGVCPWHGLCKRCTPLGDLRVPGILAAPAAGHRQSDLNETLEDAWFCP